MVGQVPNVVFPGAVIPENDGTVKIYYGGADYVQCLATAKLDAIRAHGLSDAVVVLVTEADRIERIQYEYGECTGGKDQPMRFHLRRR